MPFSHGLNGIFICLLATADTWVALNDCRKKLAL
jgi:hypothetical protein